MNGPLSPSITRILGSDDENEMREMAEMLRKRMTKMRAKKSPPKQPDRQPPGSDNEAMEEADAASSTSNGSTTSVESSSASEILDDPPRSPSSSSLGSERRQISGRTSRSRKSRAIRTLRSLKVHVQKRTQRKSVFMKDTKSVIFEAYLVYPVPGPFPGKLPPPPMKLPFGHRRLNREIKHTLSKFNPWDILLILSPQHRLLVDRVVQYIQHAATGTTNVCLVAIDVDGHVDVEGSNDSDVSDVEAGDLVWTRMVLFFRHEPVHARRGSIETKRASSGGRPGLAATLGAMFLGGQRKSRHHLHVDVQEMVDKQRREYEQRAQEERKQRELEAKERLEIKLAEHKRRDEEQKRRTQQEERRQREERRRQQQEHESAFRVEVEKEQRRLEQEKINRQRWEDDRKAAEERQQRELKGKIEAGIAKRDAETRARQEKEKRREETEAERRQREELEELEENIRNGLRLREMTARQRKEQQDREAKETIIKDEKAVADKARPAVTLEDAVGRKYSFPFHLVQTWEVSSKLP